MATSQPSVRSFATTGSVVRAAICTGCWGLTSAALAQVSAPPPVFQSQQIQPWQDGKPVEFHQRRPVAPDQAISGDSAAGKPGNEGIRQETPSNVEDQVLLPLLLEEKRLLEDYGPDHADVRSVRERIQLVREHLARRRPARPQTVLAPLPSIPVQTPYREVPSTTASTNRSRGQTLPLPLPPVRSQIREPGRTEGNTQTATSKGHPELIRPAGFSTAANPIRDAGTAPASLAASPPTVVMKPDTHPAAVASTNPSAQAVVSPPSREAGNSVSRPSHEQPRGSSFFETGFGQLIGILGAVLLGVLIHLIALVFILRRYSAHLARVSRFELANPAAVGFVGEESAAGSQTVAAGSAPGEETQSSTAETFDIGPTYAEEMQQKQEALNNQEEAVLRQIFELNMQIREQLGQLSGGAA